MNNKVSVYHNAKDLVGHSISLQQVLYPHAAYRQRVDNYRLLPKEEQRKLKPDFPIFRVSGVWNTRCSTKVNILLDATDLVLFDFDSKDNIKGATEIKSILKRFESCFYAGVSISGEGVISLFKCEHNGDKDKALNVQRYLVFEFIKKGLVVDTNRLGLDKWHTISYDCEAHFNENAKPETMGLGMVMYNFGQKKEKNFAVFQDGELEHSYQNFIYLAENYKDDLFSDYNDWLKCFYIVANNFGTSEKGFYLFNELSKLAHNYNENSCKRQWQYAHQATKQSGNYLGTLYNFFPKYYRNEILAARKTL